MVVCLLLSADGLKTTKSRGRLRLRNGMRPHFILECALAAKIVDEPSAFPG